jgi:tetratricopeptide (TPR) repeat protein
MPPSPLPAPFNVPQVQTGPIGESRETLYASSRASARPFRRLTDAQRHPKGQPADALRLISEAMRMRKPSPQILLNYGMILHALDRSEEALASFDAALKQRSKFAEALNNRGAVLAGLGRHEEALECFRKALALLRRRTFQPRLVAASAWSIR